MQIWPVEISNSQIDVNPINCAKLLPSPHAALPLPIFVKEIKQQQCHGIINKSDESKEKGWWRSNDQPVSWNQVNWRNNVHNECPH